MTIIYSAIFLSLPLQQRQVDRAVMLVEAPSMIFQVLPALGSPMDDQDLVPAATLPSMATEQRRAPWLRIDRKVVLEHGLSLAKGLLRA